MGPFRLIFCFLLIFIGASSRTAGAQCPSCISSEQVGTVQDPALAELSGIVESRHNPGVLWAHNDSGDTARIFALNHSGRLLGIYNITGASAVDWEDIAIGPGSAPGTDDVYMGDIGDNGMARSNIVIYRIAEPVADANQTSVTLGVGGVEAFPLIYPGPKRNAETLMVDPLTNDIYIVSKEIAATATVYRKPAPHVPNVTATLELITTIPTAIPTGGDISPGGDQILVRTYVNNYLWVRGPGMTIADALLVAPCAVALLPEAQGEAVGFAGDGSGYFTTSEGASPPINFYKFVTPCSVSSAWSHYK